MEHTANPSVVVSLIVNQGGLSGIPLNFSQSPFCPLVCDKQLWMKSSYNQE